MYRPLNIYVVLVGVEVWTHGNRITVDTNNSSQTLKDFCDYRRDHINPFHNNDNAHLITYVSYGV